MRILVVGITDRLASDVRYAFRVEVRRPVIVERRHPGQREDLLIVDELADARRVVRPAAMVIALDERHLAAVHPTGRVERVEVRLGPVQGTGERRRPQRARQTDNGTDLDVVRGHTGVRRGVRAAPLGRAAGRRALVTHPASAGRKHKDGQCGCDDERLRSYGHYSPS